VIRPHRRRASLATRASEASGEKPKAPVPYGSHRQGEDRTGERKRDPTGEGASLPGPRALHPAGVHGRRARFPAAGPAPCTAPIQGLHNEAINGGSLALTRPVFPLPVAPVWDGALWLFPHASDPAVASDARRGGGTDHEHFSGLSVVYIPILSQRAHSCRATSCRTHLVVATPDGCAMASATALSPAAAASSEGSWRRGAPSSWPSPTASGRVLGGLVEVADEMGTTCAWVAVALCFADFAGWILHGLA